jgi:DNA helicase-2/ATP-dependent DNA helicase PcrA
MERKADGVELRDQAILVRSISRARLIEGELLMRDIPYKVTGGTSIDEAKHVKDLLSFARVTVNPSDEPAWLRILTLVPGIGDRKAVQIAKDILTQKALPAIVPMLRDIGRKHQMMLVVANALDRDFGTLSAVDSVSAISAAIAPLMEHEYGAEWKRRKADIDAVISLAGNHRELDDFLMILTVELSIDRASSDPEITDGEAPLTISTVHSAKGLEWNTVYIPSFVLGHIPSFFSREPAEQEEEKRIFYVAITRAQKRLVLVKPDMSSNGRISAASTFEPVINRLCSLKSAASAAATGKRSFALGVTAPIQFRR